MDPLNAQSAEAMLTHTNLREHCRGGGHARDPTERVCGVCFREVAGSGAGETWSNSNGYASAEMLPSQRSSYVFSCPPSVTSSSSSPPPNSMCFTHSFQPAPRDQYHGMFPLLSPFFERGAHCFFSGFGCTHCSSLRVTLNSHCKEHENHAYARWRPGGLADVCGMPVFSGWWPWTRHGRISLWKQPRPRSQSPQQPLWGHGRDPVLGTTWYPRESEAPKRFPPVCRCHTRAKSVVSLYIEPSSLRMSIIAWAINFLIA